MPALQTPSDIDRHASKCVQDALLCLQRGFAEGIGSVQDFPLTLDAFKRLGQVLDKEQAIETSLAIREGSIQEEGPGADAGGRRLAVFVDGSSNSYAALQWAVEHLLRPEGPAAVPTPAAKQCDHLHLVNVIPYKEFTEDAQRVLQQAYDFAHHAGVRTLCRLPYLRGGHTHQFFHRCCCRAVPGHGLPPSHPHPASKALFQHRRRGGSHREFCQGDALRPRQQPFAPSGK